MNIQLARIYDDKSDNGFRVLVDRIWPRGISKDEAKLDDWWKDLAPSAGLRKWFGHDADKWSEFRKTYMHELSENKEKAREHLNQVNQETLVLLYGTRNEKHSHAHILKEYLEKLG